MKQNIYKLSFLIIGIFIAVGTSYLNAWTGPTQTAPNGNVDAPVNLSALSQVKLGGLSVASLLSTGAVGASQYCDALGQNCFLASDVSSTEIVLNVNNGTGVSTAPGGVTVDFTQETTDSQNAFNLTSDSFTSQSGVYTFELSSSGCGFASDNGTGSDQFYIQLRKNGVPVLVSPVFVSQAGYNCLQPQVSGIVQANSGDVFTMYAWHDEVATNISSTMRATKMNGNGGTSIIPSGAIMPFNLTTCPTGWKPSDGTNGTMDLRGVFLRGMESFDGGATSSTTDPDRSGSSTLGSYQADEFKSHNHTTQLLIASPGLDQGNTYSFGNFTTGSTGGSETRPKNRAVLYCQKI